MKQRELEMKLQSLDGFESPKPHLEQYMTPAKIAADILYTAYAMGDIQDRRIIDLGTGTGIFAIGACLLGAKDVSGTDIDHDVIEIARQNVENIGCEVDIYFCPVKATRGEWNTCIMNPPFGSQNKHADLPFLDKAMEISSVIYSLHNAETVPFLKKRIEDAGNQLDMVKNYSFEIPHMFEFHKKEKVNIDVSLLRTLVK